MSHDLTKADFIRYVNDQRLYNKDKWVFWQGTVSGKQIQYKAYNTWIQILRIDSIDYSSAMGLNVTQFKEHLEKLPV